MTTRSARPRKPLRKLVDKLEAARSRHRERHTPSGFGFAFADRVDYLPGDAWDHLCAGKSVFLSRAYLRCLEQNSPDDMTQRYALMFRSDRPVAAIAAQIVEVAGDRVGSRRTKVLTRLRERVLVCGNLLTWGPHGVALADGEPAEELWTGVAEALYRIRRAEKLAGQTDLVMIKDLPPDELAGAAPMRRFSFATVETEPNMVLDLTGIDGFEAYLARLNKKYRKAAKEIARDVEAAGLTVEPLRGMHARGDELHRLYLDVHEHAQVRVATFPSGYLPGLERALGSDAFRCTVIRRGDELVAFETTLRDGDTAIGYYIGFDKQLNQSVPLYFRLLQCVAADAIDLGCARVSLGRTALEPKARLGGQPAPLAVLVRHRVPAFNALLRVLLRGVEFEGPPERNPFK